MMNVKHFILGALTLAASGSLFAWYVEEPEVRAFYDNIARAKIGKVVECTGQWAISMGDPPNVVPVRCASLGLPEAHQQNYVNINRYLHNGWEVIDRQTYPWYDPRYKTPVEGFLRVVVRLRKVEARKEYEDIDRGPMRKP